MKRAIYFGLILAVVALGCGGEETKEDANKPLLELKISAGVVRSITVSDQGNIAEVISPSRSAGKLKAADLTELKSLASKVEWAKIPAEGYKTGDGTPVSGGRSYDITYNGITPPRSVHTVDGAKDEDSTFRKLIDTIENDANKIGK